MNQPSRHSESAVGSGPGRAAHSNGPRHSPGGSTWARIACLAAALLPVAAFAASSQWAYFGSNGQLAYKTWNGGNKIMDFSWAGYKGGGVALPTPDQIPVKKTVSPSGGDDTTNIQNAINAVAAMTPDANGFRGAVLLTAGTFKVGSVINLNASGVVLRGSGSSGGNMTSLSNTNHIPYIIKLAGSGGYSTGTAVNITDSYVPSGATSFHVTSTTGLLGKQVLITRTVTQAWIDYVGMSNLGTGETWLQPGDKLLTDRVVTAVSGNTVTIDAPLTDSFDSTYLGSPVGTIATYTFAGRIGESGIEHLRIECNADGVTDTCGAIDVTAVIDCWVSDLYCHNGMNTVGVTLPTKQCTFDRVICEHDVGYDRTQFPPPPQFYVTGTQLLLNRCQALLTSSFSSTVWSFITASKGTGPIVLENFYSTELSGVAPHMRWTTGVLTDQGSLPDAPSNTEGIAYGNRGSAGSGHGWTTGWSVAWNVDTPYLRVQQAPGTLNWSIGSGGTPTTGLADEGTFDSTGVRVTPSSLYLEQLDERLGDQALANIGYPKGGVTVAAADGFYNTSLPSVQGGTFTAEFDANTSLAPSNTTLAFCNGSQSAYTGLAVILRFNNTGTIDARNGGAYAAANSIPYYANSNYHFRIVINVPAHTYSAYVTPAGGTEQTIGVNYAFRTEQAAVTQLDTFNLDVGAASGGTVTTSVPKITLTLSPSDGFYNSTLANAQTGTFTTTFDATPSLSPSNTTLALCQGSQSAFTGLAVILRFNNTGTIDARNGGAYTAATSIPYNAGVAYHFRIVVNVTNHTYSAYVTAPGGSEQTIGTNYAFRTEQAGVTQLDTFNVDVGATPGGTMTTTVPVM